MWAGEQTADQAVPAVCTLTVPAVKSKTSLAVNMGEHVALELKLPVVVLSINIVSAPTLARLAAPFGPTTVEQHDPQFLVSKVCCVWSGNAWPYATSQTLTAMANLLNDYRQRVVTREEYARLLRGFALDQRKNGVPYIAEAARAKAAAADVVVVNTHLYGLHVGGAQQLLPEHDIVIVDEAHQLEDVMSDTVGLSIGPGRLTRAGNMARRVLAEADPIARVLDAAPLLRDVLARHLGERLPRPLPDDITGALAEARLRSNTLLGELRGIDTQVDDAKQRVLRAQQLIGRLIEHIDLAISHGEGFVAYVAGGPDQPRLEVAPLDVGPVLSEGVWSKRTAVLASATIPLSLAERVGIPAGSVDQLSVESPFDYQSHGLLYCALHLPDPRNAGYAAAMHAELEALIAAAGGRTLALFTSWRAMEAAAEALRPKLASRILTQRDLPKPALVRAFADDEASCLFATAGFFQGVDIPGRTLSLVTIDRIPFPRPDDPLLSARRELLGPDAFRLIDLPRAAMLLAQATGRLLRTTTDRGAVAVFDRRLGTAGYRWDLVRALPPMRRTRHRAEAEAFLREITGAAQTSPS